MAGRRKKKEHHEEHPDERWLVTFADMLVLLLALFIVLYALGDMDPRKAEPFAQSVRQSTGQVFTGGQAIMETGGQADTSELQQQPPSPSLQAELVASAQPASKEAVEQEEDQLQELKMRIDAAAADDGLREKVETEISKDGLTVRLLSDDLMFDSGSAELKARSGKIIGRIAQLMRLQGSYRIRVSGHTDSVPVSGRYPSNWELSTARASAVVRALARNKVAPARMEAAGKAHLAPVGSNKTSRGRSKNRRVEILIPRQKVAAPATTTSG